MNVILTVETVKLPLAANQTLTDWVFIIASPTAQVARQDVSVPTATFELPDGAYSATAQRFDSGGNAFGSQVSATFTVTTPTAVVDPAPVDSAADPVYQADPATEVTATGDAAGSMTVTMS